MLIMFGPCPLVRRTPVGKTLSWKIRPFKAVRMFHRPSTPPHPAGPGHAAPETGTAHGNGCRNSVRAPLGDVGHPVDAGVVRAALGRRGAGALCLAGGDRGIADRLSAPGLRRPRNAAHCRRARSGDAADAASETLLRARGRGLRRDDDLVRRAGPCPGRRGPGDRLPDAALRHDGRRPAAGRDGRLAALVGHHGRFCRRDGHPAARHRRGVARHLAGRGRGSRHGDVQPVHQAARRPRPPGHGRA